MNAVGSTTSVLALRLGAASAVALFALQFPGCSGTVTTVRAHGEPDGGVQVDVDGSPIPGSSTGGYAGKKGGGGSGNFAGIVMGGGRAGGFGGPVCGNGIIEPGEACDGQNLGNETCSSVTMGSEPNGYLLCSGCVFNTSACTVYPGTGGIPGAGGRGAGGVIGSAGGFAGTMGVDPTAVCYASGGVPEPSNPNVCLTGTAAQGVCASDYLKNRLSTVQPNAISTCASGCGCSACTSVYDKCVRSPDCISILNCAENTNCNRMVDCYQPATCQSVIDAAGGERGRAAIDMSSVLSCLNGAGCTVSCPLGAN